jgi:aryl-alcohol dehydrogenase-like predicted oxidoreductase
MQFITLGRTGLKVSILGVGGGGPSRLGQSAGIPASDSADIVRLALDSGVNFIDTAEAYRTEEVVGQAIRGIPRDRLVLSTKKSTWSEQPVKPADVLASLEASLQRLGTDYVDIYSLHGVGIDEYEYLVNEIVPVMQQLKTEGKIRFIGITEAFHSDTQHIMLQRALQDDEVIDYPVWDVIMVGFNLLNQSARQHVLVETIRRNIGIQVMFAVRLALSRPERLKEVVSDLITRGQLDPTEFDVDDPLGFVITEGGAVSIPDAAYRFARDESGTHVILSGTGNLEHMRANLASIERPPLPVEVTERLKYIFRRVDSVSGQ